MGACLQGPEDVDVGAEDAPMEEDARLKSEVAAGKKQKASPRPIGFCSQPLPPFTRAS